MKFSKGVCVWSILSASLVSTGSLPAQAAGVDNSASHIEIDAKQYQNDVVIPLKDGQLGERLEPAYTTFSCGSPVIQKTQSWDSDDYSVSIGGVNYGYINAVIDATISAIRSGCGREFRGNLKVKGSTKSTGVSPTAIINKRVVNGCKVIAHDTDEAVVAGSLDNACGAHFEFSWTVNGTSSSQSVDLGCSTGAYVLPPDSSTELSSVTNCRFPPADQTATSTIATPTTDYNLASCNGKYWMFWDAVPGATSYQIWTSSSTPEAAYKLWEGTATGKQISASSSVQLTFWARACTGSSCGFFDTPISPAYYSGCP